MNVFHNFALVLEFSKAYEYFKIFYQLVLTPAITVSIVS